MRDRLNGKQKKAIKEFEGLCGFDFMYIDQINEQKITFREAWNSNIRWLEDVVADTSAINLTGCGMLIDI